MNRLLRYFAFIFLFGLVLASTRWLHAGGGPTGCLVIYDPTDVTSVTIAVRYQQLRNIPDANMIPYVFPVSLTRATGWDFIYSVRRMLAERGIEPQVQAVAVAGAVPLSAGQTTPTGNIMCLHSLIYLSPNFGQANFPTSIYNPGNLAYSADRDDFRGPAPAGTRTINGSVSFDGYRYWPSSALSYPGRNGMSPKEILTFLERTRTHDATKAGGTIYWPLNSDIRSLVREGQISEVAGVWDSRGIRYSVSGNNTAFGPWVSNRTDVAGAVVGLANFNPFNGNEHLPGSWVDHLTSNGGGFSTFVPSQTSATQWLRAGVAGTSGSISEPYAVSEKFPHAHLHTHLRAGASLAEAFWLSIQAPGEIMPLGDPLLQPYADFPNVSITSPATGTTVNGTIQIAASASATGGKTLDPNLDLFIGGRRIAIGVAGEPVVASRVPGGFSLNTQTLGDGWHDVRVVAYNADSVRTQSEAQIALVVNNAGRALNLTGPATVNPDGTASFTANVTGFSDLTSLTLEANGRVLGTFPLNGGVLNVDLGNGSNRAPLDGSWTLFAVGTRANGQRVFSAPFSTTIEWPPQAPVVAPSLGPVAASVRFFPNTIDAAFNWDSTPPTATFALPVAGNGIVITPTTIPGVTLVDADYATNPGYQIDFLFYAPADDWYELGLDFAAQTNSVIRSAFIGGVPLKEWNATFQPRRLAAGWHNVRVRTSVRAAAWASMTLRVRGGFSQDFLTLPGALIANAGTGSPIDAPTISSIGAASNPVTGTTVALTGNATIGGGSPAELAGLTYHWAMLKGPRPVTFSATGTNAARTTTATFVAPGEYEIGLRVAGPNGSAFLSRNVTVSRTPSATLTMDFGPLTQFLRGESIFITAVNRDQFGVRVPATALNPAQPTVQWTSTDPQGTFTPIDSSAESVIFRSFAGASGNQSVSITATGVNGRPGTVTRSIQVFPNIPPSGANLISIQQAPEGGEILLGTLVSDSDSRGTGLRYLWTVVSQPAGQSLTIANPTFSGTTATFSGPGTYVVQLDVEDAVGQKITRTATFVVSADGKLAFFPMVSNPGNRTVAVGARADFSSVIQNATSVQWQRSTDSGATWQDIPGATQSMISVRTASTSESGTRYRVVATNAVATVPSSDATLTVTSPAAGALAFVQISPQSIQESAGDLVVTLQRLGNTTGPVSATVTLDDSGGTLGVDFLGFDGTMDTTRTVNWADGDASDRTFRIPILNDSIDETEEFDSISLVVGSVVGGAAISNGNLYVEISDDDGLGSADLLSSSATVFESDGTAVFTVRRSGGSSGNLTVSYSVESGANITNPAVAGQDFTAVSGNFTWANGDVSDRQIVVALNNDGLVEGPEQFSVSVAPPEVPGLPRGFLFGSTTTVTLRDAPFQTWQKDQWPWAFPKPAPSYASLAQGVRSFNPQFWFRFNETTGTSVTGQDGVGNPVINGALTIRNSGANLGNFTLGQAGPRPPAIPGLEANNTGLITTSAGSSGTPALFTAGGYVNIGNGNGLAASLNQGFTFTAFVRTNVTDRAMNLIGAVRTGGTQFSVFLNRTSANAIAPHTLRVYVRTDGSSGPTSSSGAQILDYWVPLSDLPTGSLCDGQWHHIAITVPRFTSTDNANFPRFYFDGVEANVLNVRGTENITGTLAFTDFLNGGSGVHLAANGAASPGGFFSGAMDEVAFISAVLTPEQIQLLSEAGPGVPPPASLQPAADYDGDGLNNLLEYALGLNPIQPTASAGFHSMVRVNTDDYLAITYTENLASSDVNKVVEVSSDLIHWTSGPAATTEVSNSILGTLRTVTVRDNVPMTTGSRRFIRVKVTTR